MELEQGAKQDEMERMALSHARNNIDTARTRVLRALKTLNFLDGINARVEDVRNLVTGRLFKAAIASRENFKYVLAAENLHVDSQVDEKPIAQPLINERLSFMSEFSILNGIPSFLLKSSLGSNTATCSRFSSNGSFLVVGYDDGYVRIWDADNGILVREQLLHESPVSDVEFQGDGNHTALSCDLTGQCYIWYYKEDRSYPVLCEWGDVSAKMAVAGRPYFVSGVNNDQTLIVYPVGYVQQIHSGRGQEISVNSLRIPIFDVKTTLPVSQPSMIGVAYLQQVPSRSFLACCKLSPTMKGVLTGYIPLSSQSLVGSTWVWPDFQKNSHAPAHLSGGMAAWSSSDKFIVTWDSPLNSTNKSGKVSYFQLWSTEDIKQTRSPQPSKVVKSNEGHSICWCDFIEDSEKITYLACCYCVPDGEVVVTLYDLATLMPMHAVNTGILNTQRNWPLSVRQDRHTFDNQGNVRGMKQIQPIDITSNSLRVGCMDTENWKLVLTNILHGVEEGSFDVPEDCISQLGECRGVSLAKREGNLAVIGTSGILLLAFPMRRINPKGLPDISCTTSLSLEKSSESGDMNLGFSGNGQFLGVLQQGHTHMNIFDLDSGWRGTLKSDAFHHIAAFSICESGQWVATCSHNMHIALWEVSGKAVKFQKWIDRPAQGGPVGPKAFSLVIDDETMQITVSLCDAQGDLVWFVGRGSEDMEATGSRGQLWNPLRWSSLNLSDDPGAVPDWMNDLKKTTETRVGAYACQFSLDGKWGVVMPRPSLACVWDLKRRCKVHEINTEMSMSGEISPNLWNSVMQWIHKGGSTDSSIDAPDGGAILSTQASSGIIATSDCGKWNLSVAYEDAEIISEDDEADLVVELPQGYVAGSVGNIPKANALSLLNVDGKLEERTLYASDMQPARGCTLSPDGRRVACVSGNRTVRVWSARAVQGLLPDYFTLSKDKRLEDKTVIEALLERYGIAAFNLPDHTGMPFFMQAISFVDFKVFNSMDEWRSKEVEREDASKGLKVRLRQDGGQDCISLAINARSPAFVRKIIEAVLSGYTQDYERTHILESSAEKLQAFYPKILSDALNDSRFLINVCKIRIPEDAFQEVGGKRIIFTNNFLSATQSNFQEIVEERMSHHSRRGVRVLAKVRAVPFSNAAQMHPDGLLSPLVIGDAPITVYTAPPIQAIIDYKWRRYAQLSMLNEVAHYFMMLATFTVYCYMVARRRWESKHEMLHHWEGQLSLVLLIISAILGAINILREFRQLVKHLAYNGMSGIAFYFTSAWNWVEMSSYVLLVVVIPVVQTWDDPQNNIPLTWLLAAESVVLWWKVLYYMRAFKPTGQLVISISNIIADMGIWLFLSFMVVLGFGTAFFVIYRHVRFIPGDLVEDAIGNVAYDDLMTAYESYARTFATIFAYALGDFDLEVIYNSYAPIPGFSTPQKFTGMIFFIIYMVLMAIILLNLLIALMAGSYDRVKSAGDEEFMSARASAILDVETMMSSRTQENERESTKRFLHVIEPVDALDESLEDDKMESRLNAIATAIRDNAQSAGQQNDDKWRDVEDKLENIMNEIAQLKQQHQDSAGSESESRSQ